MPQPKVPKGKKGNIASRLYKKTGTKKKVLRTPLPPPRKPATNKA